MPSYIDPETMNVDKLPSIWSPVQWDLSEEERIQELHMQALASLLWTVDIPEAMLRLLTDRDFAIKLAQAGRKRAEDFAVEKIVGQYEELFGRGSPE